MERPVEKVVLVVVDALRDDRVGISDSESLTPYIDQMADRGERLSPSYACINSTDGAMTSILSGQYPTRHGIVHHGANVTDEELEKVAGTRLLPEILPPKYDSTAVDILGRWHRRGFDEYLKPKSHQGALGILNRIGKKIPHLQGATDRVVDRLRTMEHEPATAITDTATAAIKSGPQFLLVHYWDVHIPYEPPAEYLSSLPDRQRYRDDTRVGELIEPISGSYWADRLDEFIGYSTSVGEVHQQYDAAIKYVDAEIERLVESIRSESEEVAVLVTADHGESLTEHNIIFDHHGLYEPTMKVPLVVDSPGIEYITPKFVQHCDLAPTIVDMCAGEYEPKWFDGETLLADSTTKTRPDRETAYFEEGHTCRKRGLRTERYKFIKTLDDGVCRYCDIPHAKGEIEVYDLISDPEEVNDITEEDPKTAKHLESELTEMFERLPDSRRGEYNHTEESEVMERLQKLGYK